MTLIVFLKYLIDIIIVYNYYFVEFKNSDSAEYVLFHKVQTTRTFKLNLLQKPMYSIPT